MIRLSYLFTLTFFCCGGLLAAPKPQDFAFAATISGDASNTIYRVTLPDDIYRKVTRGDLSDMTVFNAKGELVPFLLREAPPESVAKKEVVALPFFPVSANRQQNLDDFDLRVEKTTAGIITELRHDQASRKGSPVILYILDGSQLSAAISALHLEWLDKSDSYIGQISIDASDDLKNWRTVMESAMISRLNHGGQRVEQKIISLPYTKAKYFRLSWPSTDTPLSLVSVAAEIAPTYPPTPLRWLKLTATKTNVPYGYEFDTLGLFPIQRLRINLPQDNSQIEAKIFTRADAKETWRQIYQGEFYTLRIEGRRFNKNELVLNKSLNRYWRIELPEDTHAADVPTLEVGWRPHELSFIARGSPPYRLAFGSARQEKRQTPDSSLHNIIETNNFKVHQTGVGPTFQLGGIAMLKPPAPPLPWKTWVLWGVLASGVALLAWMAVRLLKQIEKP